MSAVTVRDHRKRGKPAEAPIWQGTSDFGQPAEVVEEAITYGLPAARQTLAMHCEVAQRFAGWLGLGSGTQAALEHPWKTRADSAHGSSV